MAQLQTIAGWETELLRGALQDALCANGGPPLSSAGRPQTDGVSDPSYPFGQRFPNPTPAVFEQRVRLVGRQFGFRLVSLRLLHPDQLAPLLVIRTSRTRKAFVHELPTIMRLLDPSRPGAHTSAVTFEGFYLEAEDASGPFVSVFNAYRGEVMGGQWAANPCLYPHPHGGPITTSTTDRW